MIVRLLCAALAAAFVVVPFGATAQNPGAGRFGVPDQTRASRLPPGLDTTPITVVVFLAGDSVATAQEAAGRRLSRGEKDGIKHQRSTDQNAIRAQIEAAGGTILNTFQSAVNGIKVRIASNKVFALGKIAGVTDVKGVNRYERDNTVGVPRVQAPAVWSGLPAFRGEGIKVAIIDTGIDYTHANFGGPGTVAAYDAAFAANTLPANPALFGPGAPRVKGGTDLVGDDYDANVASSVPQPDPNPLDCNLDVGHGSHVAGTAAGNGVLANGTTYNGPYDSTTYSNSFRIGPGVAPKADLYAIRVFGCFGSTDVVVEALDWAVDHDMDVVNMSLGSSFGTADTADAQATDNAVKAGIIVVASAGNSGDIRYITGSPATAARAVSVAAATTPAAIPFGNMALPMVPTDAARTVSAQDSNGATYASPFNGTVKVVRTPTNGCKPGLQRRRLPGQRRRRRHDRRGAARHVRSRLQGDLRSAGRCDRRDHGQQLVRAAALRGNDLPEPGHRRLLRRYDSVLRREGHGRQCGLRRREARAARRDADLDHDGAVGAVRPCELQLERAAQRRQRAQAGHHGPGLADHLDLLR